MFRQINKVDTSDHNIKGVALINIDTITRVSQQSNHYSNKLYDENQKLVKQDLDSPFFEVNTSEGLTFVVEEKEYDILKKDLKDLGFTEIKKVNRKGEEGLALIKLESVKAIVEQAPVQEMDEDGNPKVDNDGNPVYKPTQYAIIRKDGVNVYVFEKEYKNLVETLSK